MTVDDAIRLIGKETIQGSSSQIWADLGSGNGLFSRALLAILPAGSTIHAVDIQDQNFRDSSIVFHRADFAYEKLSLPPLDGIIMSNALHYVKHQEACIKKLRQYFGVTTQKFILVEYDTISANPWVPYPVSFSRAREIFTAAGFSQVVKIGERPSVYRRDLIYAALIT